MALRKSSVLRNSLDQPQNTLLYLDPDETQETSLRKNGNGSKLSVKFQDHTKTEKSVHFATQYESVSETESTPDSLKTSRDAHTLLPSEHLYSGDTFISETQNQYSGDTFVSETVAADSTDPTEQSYATNTFVGLDSDDEMRTASDISHTESFASSTVFSQDDSSHSRSSGQSGTTHREWKDVTDIVKDINELEESEFVTRHESFFSEDDETTDITESEDEEMAAIQRDHFILSTIRRLRLRDVLSPRSLTQDMHTSTRSRFDKLHTDKEVSAEETAFCKQMIKNCKRAKREPDPIQPMITKQPVLMEHYGLSSALVDRLKVKNLQQMLAKKAEDIEKSTQESLKFIEENQDIEAERAKQKFISQMMAQVQSENTEDRIQAHLIKMHPVKHFAEFLNGLPKIDENSREILYKYKCRLEAEMNKS